MLITPQKFFNKISNNIKYGVISGPVMQKKSRKKEQLFNHRQTISFISLKAFHFYKKKTSFDVLSWNMSF